MSERCYFCRGTGWREYCVNPDNGHQDTRASNLRYEKYRCDKCDGSGQETKEPKP